MKSFLLVVFILNALTGFAQTAPEARLTIRLNQVGFYPGAPKVAIVTGDGFTRFSILTGDNLRPVFTGSLVPSAEPALNGKRTLIADFSSFGKPGKYILSVDGLGNSYPFIISPSAFSQLATAAIKAYYYQRASAALPEKYAGKWNRIAGHPDDKVLIHSSAATPQRPEGTLISASKGWYDAGDYNKYVVNSGITMGTLLSLCEDFPGYINTVHTNIPESNNRVPDLLDELVWNLRWMLAMQDPNDGGVYTKLTNADFDGMVMPNVTTLPRYVVQKSTAATLDLAAVTAQASRLLKNYRKDLPGLADSCLEAAKRAWKWAQKNPGLAYDQQAMNTAFKPQITTGGYGDRTFGDEFTWAAAELTITTGDLTYYRAVNLFPDDRMPLPSWGNVRLLGYYSLLRNENGRNTVPQADLATLKKRLIALADDLITGVDDRAYRTVMGKSARDFGWGSNSTAGNQGVALIQVYKLTADKKYLDLALSNLDYLLGRNGSGYSYVTGIGTKTPMHPHHRPSVADGIADPVPGLLVGGPNPGQQDGVKVPSTVPDEAYTDNDRAYAVNEIAINWNAPLVYLANALEALQKKAGYGLIPLPLPHSKK